MKNVDSSSMQTDENKNNYYPMRNMDNLYTNFSGENKEENLIQTKKNKKTKIIKPINYYFIVLGVIALVFTVTILLLMRPAKKEIPDKEPNELDEPDEQGETPSITFDLNEHNSAKATFKDDFVIPSNKKLKVVGIDFAYKENVLVVGKNKNFTIDNEGQIKDVTRENFPLQFYFKDLISNSSNLFKDVKCFKTVNLSQMDSSRIVDVSNMFENSDFEEIYFGKDTKNGNIPDGDERKDYFVTSKIESAPNLFKDCTKLKKIELPPSFNVGLNATAMFKGCIKLEDVNTSKIVSTEIEEMDSMFEDCQSLKVIGFSNDFLTGEVKTLSNVFKNTQLTSLDISYFRLYNLESSENIFDGAQIKGTLKLGKYFSDEETRDNLFKEIAKVTDVTTQVYTPSGTQIDQVFQDIYYTEKQESISVTKIDIDYNIDYKEDENYKLYSNNLHFGLGWDYTSGNIYDLDSSVVTFNKNIQHLAEVYYSHLSEYSGAIKLNGDDTSGEGDGDDEEIRVSLNLLPSVVQMFTIQLNSYKGNSLKNVKSAYIRISAGTEVIGTYTIDDAGDNIGLLIGCFYKVTKNNIDEWYFKPLHDIIPGNVVTKSITTIQSILRSIFEKSSTNSTQF